MLTYIVRRLLLMIPTLFGIVLVNFVVLQFLPGGPIEQVLAQLTGNVVEATSRISADVGSEVTVQTKLGTPQRSDTNVIGSQYRGARGLDPELIADLERQYGLDKPAHKRFLIMIYNYVRFDFGESFFRDRSVIDLIVEKLPVSISLGLWTTLLTYFICIPLGIAKSVRDGSRFDIWTSSIIVIGYAIPGFLFAVLLIILFAGGSFWDLFPLRGLTSESWESMTWTDRIADYFWHITLPVLAMSLGGFATLTMLTKNSFLDEINKHYVVTARAKGLTERRILYGHVFRNAMLIVIAGFPSAFIGILFTGSLLIEVIFSLDGLGLLGFESALNRDYPVVLGTLYVFTLIGLVLNLLGDLVYMFIDPRIDFESREV